jgi:hypothetical protein
MRLQILVNHLRAVAGAAAIGLRLLAIRLSRLCDEVAAYPTDVTDAMFNMSDGTASHPHCQPSQTLN